MIDALVELVLDLMIALAATVFHGLAALAQGLARLLVGRPALPDRVARPGCE